MTIKQLKARIERTKAKQAELVESGDIDGAKALDATIAEFNDMIIEMADAADAIGETVQIPGEPKAGNVIDFRDAIKAGKEVEFTPRNIATGGEPGQNFVTEAWANDFREARMTADPLAGFTDDFATDTTENLPYVTAIGDDVVATEGVDASITDTELTAKTIVIGATTYSYSVFQTDEFLADDAYDINGKLPRFAGTAFGRRAFKLKAAAAKASTDAISKTMAAKSSICLDDIIDVLYALPVEYRSDTSKLVWLVSTAALVAIEKLKDADGNPIMTPANSPLGPTIKGIRYVETSELDGLGTAAKVPFLLMHAEGIVKADRGAMTLKPLETPSGRRSIFKQRMDVQAAPLPCIAIAKTAATDPAA